MKIDLGEDFEPHEGQKRILADRSRFQVVACGRRWGKTTMIVLKVIFQIMENIQKGQLLESDSIALVFLSDGNAQPVWNKLIRILGTLVTDKDKSSMSFRIKGTFSIEFWSVEAIVKNETIRGRSYRAVFIDECGSITQLLAMWQELIMPTLNDNRGRAMFTGTPKGFNDFEVIFRYEDSPIMKKYWKSFTAESIENPHFYQSEWDMAKESLPSSTFDQEYRARFVTTNTVLFARDDFEIIESLPDYAWTHRVCYWDIANSQQSSKKGNYTASMRNSTAMGQSPNVYVDKIFNVKGLWGTTFPLMKKAMLEQLDSIHWIEGEGIGSLAFEMIQDDADLAHLDIRRTVRKVFNAASKYDRASRWAIKAKAREYKIVDEENTKLMIDQWCKFPNDKQDDLVDVGSGNCIALMIDNGYPLVAPKEVVKLEIPTLKIGKTIDETDLEVERLLKKFGGMRC
jgi:phage terminase large subunit-like protein